MGRKIGSIRIPKTAEEVIKGTNAGSIAKFKTAEDGIKRIDLQLENLDEIKSFDRLGYRFDEGLSTESKYVFLKQNLI